MQLTDARIIADTIIALLAPACQRIEVAGSIRREKAEVKDIEIVCQEIPIHNLLGESTSFPNILNGEIEWAMTCDPRLRWDNTTRRRGDKYKRLYWWEDNVGIGLDLFIASDANYGNTLAIRTGNADFSRLLVTQRIHGGLMRPTMRQRDGHLWAQGDEDAFDQLVPCPEERHFFAALGVHPVPAPRERDAACIERLRRARA